MKTGQNGQFFIPHSSFLISEVKHPYERPSLRKLPAGVPNKVGPRAGARGVGVAIVVLGRVVAAKVVSRPSAAPGAAS